MPSSNDGSHAHSVTPTAPSALPPAHVSSEHNATIHILGTEFVHFYLLEEDGEITLVDAGLSGYREMLEPALASAGRSVEDVKAIVLTHADPDHVGFAGELQSTRGIPVYVHRADSDRTREGKTMQTEGSLLSMLPMLKHAQGRRALRHLIANGGAKQPKVADVIPFDDGDQLDVPGRLRPRRPVHGGAPRHRRRGPGQPGGTLMPCRCPSGQASMTSSRN